MGMDGHHLILGKLSDYLTGNTLDDTHDERYRQKIAHLLIDRKGYRKGDIKARSDLLVQAGEKKAIIKIDFVIFIAGKACMLIRYGPGSLVTRRRPALAAARLIAPYQIPVVVVTNGEDAEILDGPSGKVTGCGLDGIPGRLELARHTEDITWEPIVSERAQLESRIVYAFEVDGSCPCDDSICRL